MWKNNPSTKCFLRFLLPWLGLTSMIVFIGFMVVHPHIQYFEALKNTVVVFARLFFAVYAAAWIFDKLNAAFGCFIAFHQAFAMVAFTLPVLCVESILSIFFPETFLSKRFFFTVLSCFIWVVQLFLISED
jgi:hypothetical protein